MPWTVGIDEAGYGPNLGPLLQAAVAVRLPEEDLAGWDTLRSAIRRCGEKADGRVLVDDSKKVHSGKNGFTKLETGVCRWFGLVSPTLAELLDRIGLPDIRSEAEAEAWFQPDEPLGSSKLPLKAPPTVVIGPTRVNMVQPPRFNRIVAESETKATVLGEGLVKLMAALVEELPSDGETVRFYCDKQGGRAYYASLIEAAFPTGIVNTDIEKPEESRYRVEGLGRRIVITFRPRSDGESVAVAAASMLCKYLREVSMMRLSAFWATHVLALRPTAGYPVDAKRFLTEIEPAMTRLGISMNAVWRIK